MYTPPEKPNMPELLDRCKAVTGSDAATARAVCVTDVAVRYWRTGKRNPSGSALKLLRDIADYRPDQHTDPPTES